MEKVKPVPEFKTDTELFVISSGSMAWNHTGSWKYLEPFFEDWTPPCSNACPAGNDIVTSLRLTQEGAYADAAIALLEHNPFPATLGCICSHPCETPCNRKALGGEVAIRSVERFLGEYAIEHALTARIASAQGRHVTVVGGGPVGLSAAYFVRKLGYDVTVLIREDRPGAILSCIPSFRLPPYVLAAELERLRRMGIVFECGVTAGTRAPFDPTLSRSDAWLIAAGSAEADNVTIADKDHTRVFDIARLLQILRDRENPHLERRVAVIGGGDAAFDCARSLVRLGHEVTIIFSGSKTDLSASKENVSEALEEGIHIELSAAVRRITGAGVECLKTKRAPLDQTEPREYLPIPGTEFTLEAGSVVGCLDQPDTDLSSEAATEDHSSPSAGIFADFPRNCACPQWWCSMLFSALPQNLWVE